MSHSISVQDLKKLIDQNHPCCLIDVRTPTEFEADRIPKFINIPLNEIDRFKSSLDSRLTVITLCASGFRSATACQQLTDTFPKAVSVDGGIAQWKAAGFETTTGTSNQLSLMRQVQITVGLGVLAGIILAQTFDPRFVWFSAFWGAGLLFAGVTNTCALARLLTYMPWNK